MPRQNNENAKIKPGQNHRRGLPLACLIILILLALALFTLTLLTVTLSHTEFWEFTGKANKKVIIPFHTKALVLRTPLHDTTNHGQLKQFTIRKNEERYDKYSNYAVLPLLSVYGGVPEVDTFDLTTKRSEKEKEK